MIANKTKTIEERVEGENPILSLVGKNPNDMSKAERILLAQWLNDAALDNPEFSMNVLSQGAIYDALTGSYSRGFLEHTVMKELAEYAAAGNPISIVYLDIDHFKKFNDGYGHAVGDYVLKETARTLEDNIRQKDIEGFARREHDILRSKHDRTERYDKKPYRLGGEEFAIFLKAGIEDAQGAAERLRGTVEAQSYHIPEEVEVEEGKPRNVGVTISIGVTQYIPGHETINDTIQRADKAMYHSKQTGRNRVHSLAYGSETYQPVKQRMPEFYAEMPASKAA